MSFGFKFWKQIDYFGLDKEKTSWFVALFKKLAKLSTIYKDAIDNDLRQKHALRIHPINWEQKNIPIRKKDLKIPSSYNNDPDNYPILQIAVSKSLGRIIGFFDERNTFQIVLLDPKHNAQPTKLYDYRVDECSPLNSCYEQLLVNLKDAIKNSNSCSDNCIVEKIKYIDKTQTPKGLVAIPIEDFKAIEELVEAGKFSSIEDFFSSKIIAGMD